MDRGENDNIVILRIRILQQFPNNFIAKKKFKRRPISMLTNVYKLLKKKLVCHSKNPKVVLKNQKKQEHYKINYERNICGARMGNSSICNGNIFNNSFTPLKKIIHKFLLKRQY